MRLLGETEVPVVVKEADDLKSLELSLVENLQREELNPMEEAHGFHRLQSEFGLTQERVASAVGKDRATVANTLRLLRLPKEIQDWVAQDRLSLGHARAILALSSQRAQLKVAEKVVKQGLSVRRVEQLVQQMSQTETRKRTPKGRDPNLVAAEQKLQRSLGTNVQIFHGRSRGWIRIAYYSLKDLDRLLHRLNR